MEGGVEEYFKNAVTNRKLFENKMIQLSQKTYRCKIPMRAMHWRYFASCVKIAQPSYIIAKI